jgi:hypothetical protein
LDVWNPDQWFSENQKNHFCPETTVLMKSKNQSRNIPGTASSLPSLTCRLFETLQKKPGTDSYFILNLFFFQNPKPGVL